MISDNCFDAKSVFGFLSDRRIGKKSVTLVLEKVLEMDLLFELVVLSFRFDDLKAESLLFSMPVSFDDALAPF